MTDEFKKVGSKKFVFIDTDVFIDAITGNYGKESIDLLKYKLDNYEISVIFPETITVEINTIFNDWKTDFFVKVADNLSINKILGIQEENTNPKQLSKKSTPMNVQMIDNLINNDRKKLISTIEEFYTSIQEETRCLFSHKNTHIVNLTDEHILKGLTRSLLKKAPYSHKSTENAHTKDTDCIAFESLISYIESIDISDEDSLIMGVKDRDYIDSEGLLKNEIKESLKKVSNIQPYSDLLKFLQIGDDFNQPSALSGGELEQSVPSLAMPENEIEHGIVGPNT